MPEDLNAYLQEGKAPTKDLRGVFRRFKKTLMDIYRSIKIVNGRKAFFNNLEPIKISPEMKHIFDAMLATEDEINHGYLPEHKDCEWPESLLQ